MVVVKMPSAVSPAGWPRAAGAPSSAPKYRQSWSARAASCAAERPAGIARVTDELTRLTPVSVAATPGQRSRGGNSRPAAAAGEKGVTLAQKRCKLACAFPWEYSYKRPKLARLLDQRASGSLTRGQRVVVGEQAQQPLVEGARRAVAHAEGLARRRPLEPRARDVFEFEVLCEELELRVLPLPAARHAVTADAVHSHPRRCRPRRRARRRR